MKKNLLILALTVPLCVSAQKRDTLLNEQFATGGELPAGWLNIDNKELGGIWQFSTDQRPVTTTTAANGFAILDSDGYGSAVKCDADLISPSFDFSIYDSIATLQYSMFFNSAGDPPLPFPATSQFGYVMVSNNNGVDYTQVAAYDIESTSGNMNGIVINLNISALALGKSNVKVQFKFTGDFQQYWAIDDVKLIGITKKASENINAAPSAGNDAAVTNEELAIDIDILNNDRDNDGSIDSASVTIVAQAKNGVASYSVSTKKLTYTPNTDFDGKDTITYTVKDNKGAVSNIAIVAIQVLNVQDTLGTNVVIYKAKNTDVVFYPNPATETISVLENTGSFRYLILNTIGAEVIRGNAADGRIDISTIPAGTYYAIITHEKISKTGFFTKE